MKFVYPTVAMECAFSKLNPGAVFIYKENVYMKIDVVVTGPTDDEYNCVMLEDGQLDECQANDTCLPFPTAELRLKP